LEKIKADSDSRRITPGWPKRKKEGGHIEALKGTLVNLEVRVSKAVREGKIVVDPKNQIPSKPMKTG